MIYFWLLQRWKGGVQPSGLGDFCDSAILLLAAVCGFLLWCGLRFVSPADGCSGTSRALRSRSSVILSCDRSLGAGRRGWLGSPLSEHSSNNAPSSTANSRGQREPHASGKKEAQNKPSL
ncbi:hypothetical protein NDU88_007189 [Pleurodeles waltl]|uniref:Uncharacterized protein n=1 Tax=Pleurodeles waltl TaxID=8319 RepID=A0AAV7N1E7_PLEWA|nr:hypothetical protein NDU88_007189 [Pleurodeles waltl]